MAKVIALRATATLTGTVLLVNKSCAQVAQSPRTEFSSFHPIFAYASKDILRTPTQSAKGAEAAAQNATVQAVAKAA